MKTSVIGVAPDPRAGAAAGLRAAALGVLVAALLFAAGCGGGGDEGATDVAGEFGAAGDEAAPADAPAGAEGAETADGAAAPATDAPAPEAAPGATTAPEDEGPSFTSDQNRREVLLFFQERDSEYLGPERRKIFLTASPVDQAKQIVIEVINGPTGRDLLPTVPRETRLRGLYLDRSGTAYVDLSGEVSARHPGGTAEEIATLFSLVNSLTYNLPEIKRVHILIDGEERDTLVHLDLKRDYRQDLSIVDMEREKAG